MGLNLDAIKDGLGEKFGMMVLKVKEASPEILLVGGIIAMGGAVITGILAARKHDDIIDDHNERLELAKATHIVVADDEDEINIHEEEIRVIDDKEIARNVRHEYLVTSWEFFKLYAPTVALMGVSTACFIGMHNIQASRLTGALTTCAGLREAFQAYMDRNIELNGEESHRMCRYGWHEEELEDPETGEIKKVKVANDGEDLLKINGKRSIENADGLADLPFHDQCFEFSKRTSRAFVGNKSCDLSTLNGAQMAVNHHLSTYGWCTVNDVLDCLGMERTIEGMYTGWVDGCGPSIELGHMDPINNRWLAGYHTDGVILDMSKNVHGNVFWLLQEKKKKLAAQKAANGVIEDVKQ